MCWLNIDIFTLVAVCWTMYRQHESCEPTANKQFAPSNYKVVLYTELPALESGTSIYFRPELAYFHDRHFDCYFSTMATI